MAHGDSIREGQILTGPLFSEPMRVETVTPNGPSAWTVGAVGTQTERYRRVALYDYLLKLARVRFLLADDAGAGKTIMAGLLIRELKLRGLVERVLIVTPANLAFQWQRELKEKFDEKFLVLRGADLRVQFGVNPWLEHPQILTSLDLAKREEILPSLRQSHWASGLG